jgi:transcriptional regulator with PAS, ATPase and Fis domain
VEARDARDALLAERELSLDRMAHQLEQAREELERRGAGESPAPLAGLIYAGEPMARIVAQVRRIGPSEIAAVIIGESGTGKELVARAIHMASGRAGGPFVPVNCAAIPETLFESELFGHVKGAFTGAASDKKGLFQAARGGTLFLDELGEMPVSMQVKLLRVLQERRVRRVGAVVDEAVDVRIVAATNKELGELVEAGEFREDLYYRLAAFVLRLPPLRERRGDIALLATSLLARLGEESGARAQLTPQGAEVLLRWEWPGNVRELENVLRTACVLSEDGRIGPREILPLLQARRGQRVTSAASVEPSAPLHKVRSRARGRRPKATREEVERALAASGGALEEAAEQLGVTVRTLYRYIERLEGQE